MKYGYSVTFVLVALVLPFFSPVSAFISSSNPSTVEEEKESKGNGVEVSTYTGNLMQSIPIEVPPGTSGLTPKFDLKYQSSAKGRGGLFGSGWNVNFYFIVRDTNHTPKNLADDKYKLIWEGTSYDLIDQGGNVYNTKHETFLSIWRQAGSSENSSGE
jgi:hypothetical protein